MAVGAWADSSQAIAVSLDNGKTWRQLRVPAIAVHAVLQAVEEDKQTVLIRVVIKEKKPSSDKSYILSCH